MRSNIVILAAKHNVFRLFASGTYVVPNQNRKLMWTRTRLPELTPISWLLHTAELDMRCPGMACAAKTLLQVRSKDLFYWGGPIGVIPGDVIIVLPTASEVGDTPMMEYLQTEPLSVIFVGTVLPDAMQRLFGDRMLWNEIELKDPTDVKARALANRNLRVSVEDVRWRLEADGQCGRHALAAIRALDVRCDGTVSIADLAVIDHAVVMAAIGKKLEDSGLKWLTFQQQVLPLAMVLGLEHELREHGGRGRV